MVSKIISDLHSNSKVKRYTPSLVAKELPFYLLACGHFFAGPRYYVQRDKLEGYLIILSISGAGSLHYNEKKYKINAGEMFIIDCMEYHNYFTTPEYDLWELKWIRINGLVAKKYYKFLTNNSFKILDFRDITKITYFINQILENEQNISQFDEIMQSMMITNLVTEIIYQENELKKQKNSVRHNYIIEKIIRYFEEHYYEKIYVKEICDEFNINESHFIRIFKKSLGITPYAYILQYRINKSKGLLLDTDLSINEISNKVGFENTNDFIRNFKLLVGKTPLKFRNNEM